MDSLINTLNIDPSVFYMLVGLFAGVLVMVVCCLMQAFLSSVVSRRTRTQEVAKYAAARREEATARATVPTQTKEKRGATEKAGSAETVGSPEVSAVATPAKLIPTPSPRTPYYQYTVAGQEGVFNSLSEALVFFPEEAARYDKNHRPNWSTLPAQIRKRMTRTLMGGPRSRRRNIIL